MATGTKLAVSVLSRTLHFVTERERRFVEAYTGQAAGNATGAAKIAGYSPKSARHQASRLLTKRNIREAIEERTKRATDQGVADRNARQSWWTRVMQDPTVTMSARLKASELLAKSQGDFLERLEHRHSGTLDVGSMTDEEIRARLLELAREEAAKESRSL